MDKNIKDFIAAHPLPYDFTVSTPKNCLGWSIGAPIAYLHDGMGKALVFDCDEVSANVAVEALNHKYKAGDEVDQRDAPFCQRHIVAPFKAVYDDEYKTWAIKDANGKQAFFGWYKFRCAEAIMEMAAL